MLKRLIPATFVLLWATGFIGARYAMPWSEPFSFLAVRFSIAFAVLALIVAVRHADRLGRTQIMHAVIAGALLHGVYLGGVFWAIHRGMPAGISALIASLQPLVVAIFAGRVLGESVLARHWAGLAAGFVGVVVVLSPKLGVAGAGLGWETLAASIVSTLGISAGALWQKRFGGGGDLVAGTQYQYVGGAAVMALAAIATETGEFTLNGELIFAMTWLVLVLSIGAIFLLMLMIRDGEMSKVSSLFYLVPAVTAVMAWALFGEELTPLQIGGMAISAVGVWLATSQPATRARAAR